jgi:hypothetical protein
LSNAFFLCLDPLETAIKILKIYLRAECGAIKRPVVADHRETRILQLKIASWLKIIINRFQHSAVVLEAGHNRTGMNIVEGLTENPLVLSIVYFKTAVWWDAGGIS